MESVEVPKTGFIEKAKIMALSSVIAVHKMMKKTGAPPVPQSEYLHVPADDYHWNESYYFNFIDPHSKIGGWTRIGILPNQETDIGALMIYAGGSRVLAAGQGGRTTFSMGEFKIEQLEYHCLEPLKRWRLRFNGDMADIEDSMKLFDVDPDNMKFTGVELDLNLEGMSPCFDFKNTHPTAIAEMLVRAGTRFEDVREITSVSSEHNEQPMRISGTIKIGDQEMEFRGSGQRDHSWGVRDWSAPRLWTWLTCQFSDGLAFNLSRVAIASVDLFFGFVSRGGVNYPLRRVELETEFESDGLTQKRLKFRIEDTGGKTIEITGDVLTVAPLKLEAHGHKTLINEALTEYHFEGKTGYGIAEYLHQLDD